MKEGRNVFNLFGVFRCERCFQSNFVSSEQLKGCACDVTVVGLQWSWGWTGKDFSEAHG